MKKITCLATLLLMLCALHGFAQRQVLTYPFDKPEVKTSSDGFTDITYRNCTNMGEEGTPSLPRFSASVLLPPGTEISSVDVVAVEYYPEETGILLRPASRQFPISIGAPRGYKPAPATSIYSSAEAFPSTEIADLSTGFLRGHAIGSFNICPVTFYPSLQKVRFIKSITLGIVEKSTGEATRALDLLRSDASTDNRIRSLVRNHDLLREYHAVESGNDPLHDILLITNNNLLPYFSEYIAYKQSTGYAIVSRTVEEIYSQYTGSDNQMKIRNCILDLYQNSGISYVILAGDADPDNPPQNIVPKRGLFADPGSGYADNDIPSDMYYACLDGTWNTDGDNKWGEPAEADLYYEVAIGRLCVDNSTELENMLNKLTLYQSSPVTADILKGLMIGEQLDGSTYGDDYKEEIVTGGSMNGYVTAGIPAAFLITRLYESQGNWSKTNVFNNFNNGAHLLNHLGHSSVDYNMKMYNSDITTSNFQNNGVNHGLVIGYSQGCYNGSFDNRGTGSSYSEEDCFAEAITTLATAEVAGVSNSRYGWYHPGGTNGGSQFFDRQFFDALFGENIFLIGDMNSDSKEDNVSYINGDQVVRWCGYETNLFGDPTMDIWTAVPTEFQATYPVTISVGMDQMEFQTGTPYARIALMQNGSLIGRGLADANGDATLFFEPVVMVEPIAVSITGHNRIRHQGSVVVISDQPYVVYQSYQINDPLGNNNHLLDPGETAGLTMTLKNYGNQPASNAIATLNTTDPDISFTDNTENFGNIAAGETVSVENAFGITVSSSIPDQHVITFDVTVTADSVWNSQFTITANAPVFSIGRISINDTAGGNGNGRLDAGETVDISILTSNLGHSEATAVLAAITSASPYITVNSGTYTIDAIGVNETAAAVFNLTVAAGTPSGTSADISFTATSGGYSAQKTFIAKVGLTLEDFESGNFSHFNWTHSGNQPWTVNSVDPYEGTYSAQSGPILNNQKSQLLLTMAVPGSDSISFYVKTSCENIFDRLRFYIDAVQMGQWVGETGWTRVAYPVTAGNHTFKWEYKKDGSNSAGSDCAWLDYIIFPATGNTGLSVTGTVSYANTYNTPLSDLTIDLKNGAGNIVGTTTTNASGTYSFTSVPAGSYTFDVTSAKPWSGVTATDVLLFRKHIANIELLTGIYLSSGDVNATGNVTASDVLLLKKRIAYIINSFPTGDWLFNNLSFVVGGSNIIQDFKGIVYGDANGSYVPPVKMISAPAAYKGALSIGTISTVPGEVTLPVYISELQNLGAFQFTIQYDPAKLRFENITNTCPGMEDITVGTPVPGYITFVWVAETRGISVDNGILFNLKFTLLSGEGSVVAWSNMLTMSEFCDFNGNVFEPARMHGSVNAPAGTVEPGEASGLLLYPNPNNGSFTLQFDNNKLRPVTIRVINAAGKTVYEEKDVLVGGTYTVHLTGQPQGLYLITICEKDNTSIRRVMIRK